MNDLVVMHMGKPMVSSELVAKKFEKTHRKVMRDIENLHCSDRFKGANYGPCKFTNKMNRTYDGYMMTRDGFSFLCMGFTGEKAGAWKEAYINAFNAMEKTLLKKNDAIEWKQARLQGKETRKQVADTIKDFVEYATSQGSKSAKRYYGNITTMEYKALEMIEKNQKVPKGFRDTLDIMDLSFLNTAEQLARASLKEGMDSGMHYKEIYILAKDRVLSYAKTVTFARIESNKE